MYGVETDLSVVVFFISNIVFLVFLILFFIGNIAFLVFLSNTF